MRGARAKRTDPLWAKLTLVLGVLLVLASGGSFVGGKVLLAHVDNTVQQQNLLGNVAAGGGAAAIKGEVNIILVGLDTRDNNPAMGSRSDSIVIAHIPASHDRAYLVSIPRDTGVHIPAFKKTGYTGGTDKINASFAYGGAPLCRGHRTGRAGPGARLVRDRQRRTHRSDRHGQPRRHHRRRVCQRIPLSGRHRESGLCDQRQADLGPRPCR